MKNSLIKLLAFITLAALIVEPALAGSTTGMPWEGPIDKLVSSITGPVMFGISVLGVVVAGAMLVFGGELGDFTRKVIMLILAIALASSGTTVLAILFGNSGAVMGLYV